jgi:hypothetical protein
MLNKKMIQKELSVLDFLLLTTSKLLIGIGIGIIVATHFWFAQPYWYILIIAGAAILIPTLYCLMVVEEKKEISLKKKLKK